MYLDLGIFVVCLTHSIKVALQPGLKHSVSPVGELKILLTWHSEQAESHM